MEWQLELKVFFLGGVVVLRGVGGVHRGVEKCPWHHPKSRWWTAGGGPRGVFFLLFSAQTRENLSKWPENSRNFRLVIYKSLSQLSHFTRSHNFPYSISNFSLYFWDRDSLHCHKPWFGMFLPPSPPTLFSKLALNRGFVRCNIIIADSLAKDFWPKPVTIPETRYANPRAKILCLEFWAGWNPFFSAKKERWVRWMYLEPSDPVTIFSIQSQLDAFSRCFAHFQLGISKGATIQKGDRLLDNFLKHNQQRNNSCLDFWFL